MELNDDYAIEPRAGLTLSLNGSQSVSAGVGLHSRHESISTYFVREYTSENDYILPNEKLDLTKAIHYVLGYNKMFRKDVKFKTEVYYQDIFSLPVSADPTRTSSPINDVVSGETLVSKGEGVNYGIEFTFEKFFTNDYYFLFTSSIFSSKYKPLDGNWYNTRYNTGYISNIVGGKEYKLKDNKLLSVNFKFIWGGGKRDTPIDIEQMKADDALYTFEYYIEIKRYSEKLKDYLRLDLGVSYRINKIKTAHIFSLDLQNATFRANVAGKYYDVEKDEYYYNDMAGIIPAFNYRLEF
ncbi:TonB-dependent receptor domain-containing protein [Bacteroidota bacterium]